MDDSPDVPARARLWSLVPHAEPGDPAHWVPEMSAQLPARGAGSQREPQREPQPQPRPQPGAERGAVDSDLTDASDVAARVASALSSASSLYGAQHGSPLSRAPVERAPRRWAVPVRLAMTAGLAIALVAGAVAVRAASVSRSDLIPVELPTPGAVLGLAGDDAGPLDGAGTGEGALGSAGAPEEGGEPEASAPADGRVAAAQSVVVHVVGEVTVAGVIELPAGSRVADAIDAAGGATAGADLAALNLARILVDGEQVVVPAPGAPVAATGGVGSGATGSSGDGLVDLNTADQAALDGLPGIGPVLAGRILEWRAEHGRFADVDELGEIEGIGPTLLDKLRSQVSV